MYFNLKTNAITLLLVSSILVSCGKKSENSGANTTNTEPPSDPRSNPHGTGIDDQNPTPKICQSGKVLNILNNGINVMSSLAAAKRSIVLWDAGNGALNNELDSLTRVHAISGNGKYVLRKLSNSRYQIISGNNPADTRRPLVSFNTNGYIPKFSFSKDERYLMVKFKPNYSRAKDHITVYDLNKNRFLSRSITERKIYASALTNYSKHLVVAAKSGYETLIKIYNFSVLTSLGKLEVERTIHLPIYESFTRMDLGNGVIAVKTRSSNIFYDFDTGKEIYRNKKLHIFDIDENGDFALVSEQWEELKVMNLKTGEFIITEQKPTELLTSTCQLRSNPFSLLCKDSLNQGKVFKWNLEDNKTSTACY